MTAGRCTKGTVKRKVKLTELIADRLFVPACCICGDPAADGRLPLCGDCAAEFQLLLTAPCPECGCSKSDCLCPGGSETLFLFYYRSEAGKQIIRSLKRRPDRRTAAFLGCLIAEKVLREKSRGFDAVTFVPRMKSRSAEYGGDQSKLIAEGAARALGIPLAVLLGRRKSGTEQKLLDAAGRRRNVKKVFYALPEAADYRRVLLVDDVTTTGATLSECASILREAGVRQVVRACAARTP